MEELHESWRPPSGLSDFGWRVCQPTHSIPVCYERQHASSTPTVPLSVSLFVGTLLFVYLSIYFPRAQAFEAHNHEYTHCMHAACTYNSLRVLHTVSACMQVCLCTSKYPMVN